MMEREVDDATANTDKFCELFFQDFDGQGRVFILKSGAVGFEVGGTVIVRPLRDWFKLALPNRGLGVSPTPKTFRGKPLADMSLEELREIRELISHNGSWYDSRAEHMKMLTVVDEHIEAARKRQVLGDPE